MAISFHKEEVDFDLPSEERLVSWLENLSKNNDKKIEELTYIFCDDEYLLNINQTYLKHDDYTDIITFPYKQGPIIQSDIFISIERVRENAKTYNSTFENELLRVISHGLLHLFGNGDKTDEEREIMRKKEDLAISQFFDH